MTMTNTAAPKKRGPKPKPKQPKTRKQPTCKHCGRGLGAPPNQKGQPPHYCSAACDAKGKRKLTNARVRRHREKKRKAIEQAGSPNP